MSNKNISDDRRKYLRKKRAEKIGILCMRISIIIILLIAWEAAANNGMIDSFIMSQPSKIIKTFINLSSNDLSTHIIVTCKETLYGFLIGTSMGIFIAIILWWSNFLSQVLEPYLVVLNSLPKVALRSSNNHLGRCRNTSNNYNGSCNIISCNNFRHFKWLFGNR